MTMISGQTTYKKDEAKERKHKISLGNFKKLNNEEIRDLLDNYDVIIAYSLDGVMIEVREYVV